MAYDLRETKIQNSLVEEGHSLVFTDADDHNSGMGLYQDDGGDDTLL